MLMTSDQLMVICNQYNFSTFGNEASRSYSWAYKGGSRESDEVEEVDEDDLKNAEGAELVGVIYHGRGRGKMRRKEEEEEEEEEKEHTTMMNKRLSIKLPLRFLLSRLIFPRSKRHSDQVTASSFHSICISNIGIISFLHFLTSFAHTSNKLPAVKFPYLIVVRKEFDEGFCTRSRPI